MREREIRKGRKEELERTPPTRTRRNFPTCAESFFLLLPSGSIQNGTRIIK
jgi:hypothetical protein